MEALIIGLRFVVTADESLLSTIWQMIRETDFTPSNVETGVHSGGRSASGSSTTTQMPMTQSATSTRMAVTETMGQHSGMSTKMPTTKTMTGSSGFLASFQQLMRLAGTNFRMFICISVGCHVYNARGRSNVFESTDIITGVESSHSQSRTHITEYSTYSYCVRILYCILLASRYG